MKDFLKYGGHILFYGALVALLTYQFVKQLDRTLQNKTQRIVDDLYDYKLQYEPNIKTE